MGGKLDVSRREFLKRDATADRSVGVEFAPFRPGEATHLIVAVWDGAQRDVNGRKSVTLGWTPLALDATVQANVRH